VRGKFKPRMAASTFSSSLLTFSAICLACCATAVDKCNEGQVRDLDGSCVEKFVLPKKTSQCIDPIIDNGNAFMTSSRIVQFFCDTDYVKVPDTSKAICQITGSWSKQVPVCLMPGCPTPPAPSPGSVELSYEGTIATFQCPLDHILTSPLPLACIDGKRWNGSAPECTLVTTPVPAVDRRDANEPQTFSSSSSLISFSSVPLFLVIIYTVLAADLTNRQ